MATDSRGELLCEREVLLNILFCARIVLLLLNLVDLSDEVTERADVVYVVFPETFDKIPHNGLVSKFKEGVAAWSSDKQLFF